MMRRLLILLVILLLVAIGAAAIADLGGTVRVLVSGWQFDFSLSLLLFIALSLMVLGVASVELLRILMAAPARWRAQKAHDRQARGVDLLDQGYVALFSGDAETAFKRGRRARQLLDDSKAAVLLTLKGAEGSDDKKQVAKMARSFEQDAEIGPITKTARDGFSRPAEAVSAAGPAETTATIPVAVNDEARLEEKAAASRQTP